jgi:hypothetical protein
MTTSQRKKHHVATEPTCEKQSCLPSIIPHHDYSVLYWAGKIPALQDSVLPYRTYILILGFFRRGSDLYNKANYLTIKDNF